MIGILLALQVNEWNNNRKDRAREMSYYCKILEDLRQDAQQIDELILDNEKRIDQANNLLHLMQQVQPDRREVMASLQGSTSRTTFTFKPSTAAFDDIKSSGNLHILRDAALKDTLIR